MEGAVKPSSPLESKSKSFLISLCMLLNEILSERKSSKEHNEVNRVKEMKRLANKREMQRRADQKRRGTPKRKEMNRLNTKRYRATPRGREMKRLADKRRYERTKNLRKLCESENKIRIESSGQDIGLGDA